MASTDAQESFRMELCEPKQLLSNRQLLRSLNALINDTYGAHHRLNLDKDPLFDTPRVVDEDQLVHELGDKGRIALLFDDSLEESEGKYGQLVATGSIKPWSGTVIEAFLNGKLVNGEKRPESFPSAGKKEGTSGDTWNWEIATCASVDSPRYRRTGLVSRCVAALVQDLKNRRDKATSEQGTDALRIPVKLWVSALVGVGNQEYWARRGFELENPPEHAPKGVWSARKDFKIATMSKIVA